MLSNNNLFYEPLLQESLEYVSDVIETFLKDEQIDEKMSV